MAFAKPEPKIWGGNPQISITYWRDNLLFFRLLTLLLHDGLGHCSSSNGRSAGIAAPTSDLANTSGIVHDHDNRSKLHVHGRADITALIHVVDIK